MVKRVATWPWKHLPPFKAAVALMGLATVVGSAIGGGQWVVESHRATAILLAAPRVTVIKSRRILFLFDGHALVRSYPIDLGVDPIGAKRHADDARTPEGRFRVVSKNAESKYRRFIGIDYPDLATVDRGLSSGLISAGQAASIRADLAAGRCPDWDTAVGGGIGLHGNRVGRDWTAGCIALSDEHIEELFSVLRIGDPIEILP